MIDTPMKYNYHHWCARKGLYENLKRNFYVRIFLWYCGSTSDPRPGSSPTLLSGVWLTGGRGSAQSLLNSSTTAADGLLQDTDTHQDQHYPRSSFSFEGQRRMVGLRQWAVLAGLAGSRRRRRRRRRRASVFLGFSDRASGGEWGGLRGERPGVTLGAARPRTQQEFNARAEISSDAGHGWAPARFRFVVCQASTGNRGEASGRWLQKQANVAKQFFDWNWAPALIQAPLFSHLVTERTKLRDEARGGAWKSCAGKKTLQMGKVQRCAQAGSVFFTSCTCSCVFLLSPNV